MAVLADLQNIGSRFPAPQTALAIAASQAPLTLLHFVTFTDFTAGTVDTEYWWSFPHACRFQWSYRDTTTPFNLVVDAARNFDDRIVSLSPIERGGEHLPNAGLSDLRLGQLDVVLANELLADGTRFWDELRTHNLEYALLELRTVLVPPERRLEAEDADGTPFWDLTGYGNDGTDTETVVRFFGELTSVGPVSETEIPLKFEVPEPPLAWPRATVTAEVDPKDLGKRYPIPIGKGAGNAAENVPCINRKVGHVTTLAEEITAAQTGLVEVTDSSGFPAGTATIQVGAERITADQTGAGTNQINILTRGDGTTTGADHKAGETLVEILTANVIVFSGVEADALENLYVISPYTEERIRVTTAFTTTLADSATDSGRTISTVSFSKAQMEALMDEVLAAAAVSTQPVHGLAAGDEEVVEVQATQRELDTDSSESYGRDASGGGLTGAPPQLFGAGAGNNDKWKFTFPAAGALSGRTVKRWRYKVVWSLSDDTGPNTRAIIENNDTLAGFSAGEDVIDVTHTTGGIVYDKVDVGSWKSPSTTTVDDLGGKTCDLLLRLSGTPLGWGGTHAVAVTWVGMEIELDPPTVDRTTDAAIIAASLGFGLQFLADVRGPAGMSTDSRLTNVLDWILTSFMGGDPDNPQDFLDYLVRATVGTFRWRTIVTNVLVVLTGDDEVRADTSTYGVPGGVIFSGLLNHFGEGLGEIVAGLAFESGAMITFRPEGGSAADAFNKPSFLVRGAGRDDLGNEDTYGWAPSMLTLSDLRDYSESLPAAVERATRFQGLFDLLPPVDLGTQISDESFRQRVEISPDVNDASGITGVALTTTDLGNAEARWGERPAETVFFLGVKDAAVAARVLGFYASETIRTTRRRFGFSVPYGDAYELAPGDIVTFTPPGAASSVKARVIKITFPFDVPRVGLNLEEVHGT